MGWDSEGEDEGEDGGAEEQQGQENDAAEDGTEECEEGEELGKTMAEGGQEDGRHKKDGEEEEEGEEGNAWDESSSRSQQDQSPRTTEAGTITGSDETGSQALLGSFGPCAGSEGKEKKEHHFFKRQYASINDLGYSYVFLSPTSL